MIKLARLKMLVTSPTFLIISLILLISGSMAVEFEAPCSVDTDCTPNFKTAKTILECKEGKCRCFMKQYYDDISKTCKSGAGERCFTDKYTKHGPRMICVENAYCAHDPESSTGAYGKCACREGFSNNGGLCMDGSFKYKPSSEHIRGSAGSSGAPPFFPLPPILILFISYLITLFVIH